MTTIAAAHGVVAPHGYPQADITAVFSAVVSPDGKNAALIDRIHAATSVEQRYLALPLDAYAELDGFGAANDVFISVAVDLGAEVIDRALHDCGLTPTDVDLVFATTVTGIAAPSIDALLAPRLGLREDVKRLPVFGLGCVGGAAGIARVHDYLVGHPDDVAVLLAVELCSLTVQRDDASMPNIVASGLFGDGAAAVVLVGERRAARLGLTGPTVVASRSRLYPDTTRTMGWDIGGSGFRIVLSASVADVVQQYLGDDVAGFLAEFGLTIADMAAWVCHPGGPRVLEAMEKAFDLHDGQLDVTWRSLAEKGNLSSVSVLHVLADTIHGVGVDAPRAGEPGIIMAMGPGFCSEVVLVTW